MSRKVLDSNIGESDVDTIMNNIIAQNPQLNAQIEQVRNESNVFLCEILRIYPYEDKAFVKVLNNNKNIFCRLSHEILGNGMSINYIPNGVEETDDKHYIGKRYVKPFDNLYGIVIKVRWENLDNENVLLGYVNLHDSVELKSDSDKGEINIESGSSSISVDDERINIRTPALFVNGLPYNEPELENYYDKKESNIIANSLTESINDLDEKISNLEVGSGSSLDLSNLDVDLNLNFGLKGEDDTIVIDMDIVDYIVDKRIVINEGNNIGD